MICQGIRDKDKGTKIRDKGADTFYDHTDVK